MVMGSRFRSLSLSLVLNIDDSRCVQNTQKLHGGRTHFACIVSANLSFSLNGRGLVITICIRRVRLCAAQIDDA